MVSNFNFLFHLKVQITKLKLDKDRRRILDRRAKGKRTEAKGKHTEESVQQAQQMDTA